MKDKEQIPVWMKIIKGKTVCICMKRCAKPKGCTLDIVERDPFRGWEEELNRDKFGRSRG